MKKLLVALLLAAGVLPVFAADLPAQTAVPTKAPKQIAFPFTSSGWYAGIGSFASSTNPTVNGAPAADLQALGASIGGVGGYRFGGTNYFVDLEASAFYNNVGGSTACNGGSCSVGAKFSSIERIKIGTDINTLTSLFPQLGLPNMPSTPPQILANVSDQRMYIFLGADVDDVSASVGAATGKAWQFSPGFGLGTELLLKNASVVDIWAGYFNPNDGFSIGPAQATQGRKLIGGLNWLF